MDGSEGIRATHLLVHGTFLLRKQGFAARSVFRSLDSILISLKLFLDFPAALYNGMCMLLTSARGLTLLHTARHAKGRRKSPLLMSLSFCFWHQNCFSLKLTTVRWRCPYYLCVTVKNSISKSRAIRPAFSFFWTLKSMDDNCLMLLCTSQRNYIQILHSNTELFAHRFPFAFRIQALQKSIILPLLSVRILILTIMWLPHIPHDSMLLPRWSEWQS